MKETIIMIIKNKSQFKEQINFIETLMDKLKKDLNTRLNQVESNYTYRGIPGHNRMQKDITRIRRELNELSKMLDPYNYE
jgi:hypothetical protein